MGRKSREKRERRARGDGPIAELVADFSTPSLVALIEAAAVSPRAAHRAPSLALLFEAVIQRGRPGDALAPAEALTGIVTGIAAGHPNLFHREDFQPYDGRWEVLVPWSGHLLRMLPGAMERPTQIVRQHHLLATVIDPFIVPEFGFGLMDVGELLLRRIDQVATTLAPSWPDGPLATIGADATLTGAELDAAVSLPPIEDLVDQCSNPDAARQALERFTVDGATLGADVYSLFSPATFGTAIAVTTGQSTVALPASFLPEALTAIGVELAAYAETVSPKAEKYWWHNVGNQIGHLLGGAGYKIGGPMRIGTGAPFHSLVWFDERRILAIGNGASLTSAGRQARLNQSANEVRKVRPGVTVEAPDRTWDIPDDAEVLHVQVMAGPQYSGPLGLMLPTMSLEDLEWFVYSALPNHDDLWYFIRDITNTPGIDEMHSWDLIDQWEVWRPSKTFYRGAATLDLLSFAAHAAVVEWEDAAKSSPVEVALHRLGMRSLRDWPGVDLDGDTGVDVADIRTDEIVRVLPFAVPVAVDRVDSSASREHAETLWRLSIALDWKLTHSKDRFIEAAAASGVEAVRIRFQFEDRTDGPALTVANLEDPGQLVVGWDQRLQALLAENSYDVEQNLGRVIAELLDPPRRAAFLEAWDDAPPGIRVDGFSIQQRAQYLDEPIAAHDALHIEVLRELAAHLRDNGCEPGLSEGKAATALESKQIFPWLLRRFHATIAPLAADQLLLFAMGQHEAVSRHRFFTDKRLGWNRGFPVTGSGSEDRREDVAKTTRVIALIVDEVLAHPPAGDRDVDDASWAELLAVAELCIESCFRSDTIHWRLRDVAVELSDVFEINIVSSPDPTDIEMDRYTAARALATLPSAVPIAINQHDDAEPEEVTPAGTLEKAPKLQPLDDAMRPVLGFGIDALTGLLAVATQWEASSDAPVTRASRDEVANACVELTVGATRDEHLAALDYLTLRAADLHVEVIPHWETERRAHRLAVRPFVEAEDDHVWVLPWTAESMMRIVVNYLGDGRLPWPTASLPAAVDAAFGSYRQDQNDQLEDVIEDALRDHGFEVRGSVKPEKKNHYGLTSLSGEIDTLCIDKARSRIWVIEAKDPMIPFSARQIRQKFDDFHKTKGYIDKLVKKVEDVAESATGVATALGVDNPTRTWEVIGMAVTRRVDPAAFAVNPRIPFCVADDVVVVVDQDATPGPGFHEAA